MRIGVDGQLGGEDDCKSGIDVLKALPDSRESSVAVEERVYELGLRCVGQKVLDNSIRSVKVVNPLAAQ